MAQMLKFNDENVTALEMNEDRKEEQKRQAKNQEEVKEIRKKVNERQLDDDDKKQEQNKDKPGNELDAAGHVHQKAQQQGSDENMKPTILREQNNPHAKVWSNDPNKPFADQWGPSPNDQEVHNTSNTVEPNQADSQVKHNEHHHHRRLQDQPSSFNRTFESTISDLKQVFDTTDDSQSVTSKLQHPFPLDPVPPEDLVWTFQLKAIKYILIAGAVCYIAGRFHFGIIMGIVISIFFAWAYWNLGTTAKEGLDWQLEKIQSMKTLYTSEGESVEWLNYMVEKIWRSVDPEFFTDIEDLLEDTLQSVAPSVIQAIKVSDFDIGVQAPRIQMIRIFPPLPGQPEESIFGEAAFSFHSHPVASMVTNRGPTSTPPGLTIRFQTALKAFLEVKAELTALSGKIRFKILTSPDLPFISKATIAFTSVPKIETGVMPISKHLNIMNLPTIKTLVNEGVKLGFADLVDPKSMTIDVRALMGAFAKDTEAIGVVMVEVREASRDASIQLQDMEDSYATISLSTQPKKTASSTRVLTNDKDPRWYENLYVLVYKDDIIADAKVDVKVWDADKIKYDDMWGSVSMSVKDITQATLDKLGNVASYSQEERVVFDGWTPIDGKSEATSKVKLNMKMSFHPKYPTPDMDVFSGEAVNKNKKNKSKEEQDALEAPVLPEHNNGILSVTIHQAVDLEIGDPGILPTNEEFKHPYNPNKVVSPYAVLYINDNKVYQTRTKLRNPSPHWNAITEQFIKDVDNAFIRISVKNSVDLERDPVLGTKVLSLKDLFQDQDAKFKEIQQWIPLANGIGFGKVLLSLKYKPVRLTLPRELQGCDVGTLVVETLSLSNLKSPFDPNSITSTKATVALNVDPVILKRLKAKNIEQQQENSAEMGPTYGWYNQHLYYPLMMRYRTAVYVHITQGAVTTTKATGRFWLNKMVDNEWQDVTVGLYHYMNEHTKEANRNEDVWPEDGELGQVRLRMKIVPGFSPVHTHLRSFTKDFVAADPFYTQTVRYKAQKWIKEQEEKGTEGEEPEHFDYDFQTAVQEEKRKRESGVDDSFGESSNFDLSTRRPSSMSSEYGDEPSDEDEMMDIDDEEIEADMMDQKKKNKVSKSRVIRKVSWSLDKFKHKVDILKEGFNSETRAGRTLAKEA